MRERRVGWRGAGCAVAGGSFLLGGLRGVGVGGHDVEVFDVDLFEGVCGCYNSCAGIEEDLIWRNSCLMYDVGKRARLVSNSV